MIHRFIDLRLDLLAAMLIAAVLGGLLRPHEVIVAASDAPELQDVLPKAFGDWTIDPVAADLVVANPQEKAAIDKIYAQVLNRTYVNSRGARAMLSVAYGRDQSDSMQVHLPEGCYPAQGFAVGEVTPGLVQIAATALPVRKLVAVRGARREPITYWLRIGEQTVNDGLLRKLVQLKYGLTGRVPDGLLVRVSSVGSDEAAEFKVQAEFIALLLEAVAARERHFLAGNLIRSPRAGH